MIEVHRLYMVSKKMFRIARKRNQRVSSNNSRRTCLNLFVAFEVLVSQQNLPFQKPNYFCRSTIDQANFQIDFKIENYTRIITRSNSLQLRLLNNSPRTCFYAFCSVSEFYRCIGLELSSDFYIHLLRNHRGGIWIRPWLSSTNYQS